MRHTGGYCLRQFPWRLIFSLLCVVLLAAIKGAAYASTAGATAMPASAALAPPQLLATPASHAVRLSWAGVTGAAGYRLSRSFTPGTGFAPIAEIPASSADLAYTDGGLINQALYYYTLTALDGAGSPVSLSAEVAAMPNPQIAWVSAPQPVALSYPAGGDAPALIRADFLLDDPSIPLMPASWLAGEVRLGPASQPPAAWTAVFPARLLPASAGQPPSLQAAVFPDAATGQVAYLVCLSTDGGRTWAYYGAQGRIDHPDQPQPAAALGWITFTPPTGVPVPPAPPHPHPIPGAAEISLAWQPDALDGLAGIDIYRAAAPGDPPRFVGRVTPSAPAFSDAPLAPHSSYSYTFRALNADWRYSAPSEPLAAATLSADPVPVTLRIHVPPVPHTWVYINRQVDSLSHLPAGADWQAQRMLCDWDSLTCSLDLLLQKGALFNFTVSRGSIDTVQTLPDGNTPAPDPSFIVPQAPGVIERVVYQWDDPLVIDYTPHGDLARAGQPISVLWNQAMPPGTSMTVERLDPGDVRVAVPGQLSLTADQRTLRFTPDQPLTAGAVYLVTGEGQKDLYGRVQQFPWLLKFIAACCSLNLPLIRH